MKKTRNVLFIIMIISVITFITSFGLGFKTKNMDEFFTESYRYEKAETYRLAEEIDTLVINTQTKIINIYKQAYSDLTVDYYDLIDHETISILKNENILEIKEKANNKWFNFQNPKKEVRTINIVLPIELIVNLEIKSNTGVINLRGLSLKDLTIENDTGDINIYNTIIEGDALIDVSTGNIKIDKFKVNNLNLKTDTGKTSIVNSSAIKSKVETDTGSININKLDARDISLKTDTGKITILGNYRQHDKELIVNTGKITENGVKVKGKYLIENRNPSYGKIKAVTNTGNINLETLNIN